LRFRRVCAKDRQNVAWVRGWCGSAEFCVSYESRFSIAKLAYFAPPRVPQTLKRQRFRLSSLLQFDLSFAFGALNPSANIGLMVGNGHVGRSDLKMGHAKTHSCGGAERAREVRSPYAFA
jgi:hypothetical protein